MKSINDDQFQDEVTNQKGLVLVDFWAEWCGPCRQLTPILEEVSKDMTDVKIVKMNVDEASNKAAECGVRSIPTMFLFKDGKQIDTKIGFCAKDALVAWISSHK